jgi:uncharacterized protein
MSPPSKNVATEVLRTLHRIHRQLTDLRERLDHGPKRVRAAEANAAHRESQLAQSQVELKKMRVANDQKQLQLRAGEDKITDLQRKLNMAASNREYQALKDQMAADQMTNSVLADEILEALEAIDQFQAKIVEMEANLAAAKTKAASVRADVQQQEPVIRGDLGRLEVELKQSESALPADVFAMYERIVRQKGEDALAAIENEYCGGCHQHVPLNVVAEVMMQHAMFCRTCGRLLYVPEDAMRRERKDEDDEEDE